MSHDWADDINLMQRHYGFHQRVKALEPQGLRRFLEFRFDFLQEELDEARDPEATAEDVVDAMIDLCVVAIGTLDSFGVDVHEAWDAVLEANMAKVPGIKPERPNPLGLPDLIKPEGWKAPSHEGNHGFLPRAFEPVPAGASSVTLTDGSPVTPDHRELKPNGQQKGYVVLSDDERAKGFVRPVRDTYVHLKCDSITRMGRSISETYARDPKFYTGTFCVECGKHFTFGEPDGDFEWLDGSRVGE